MGTVPVCRQQNEINYSRWRRKCRRTTKWVLEKVAPEFTLLSDIFLPLHLKKIINVSKQSTAVGQHGKPGTRARELVVEVYREEHEHVQTHLHPMVGFLVQARAPKRKIATSMVVLVSKRYITFHAKSVPSTQHTMKFLQKPNPQSIGPCCVLQARIFLSYLSLFTHSGFCDANYNEL